MNALGSCVALVVSLGPRQTDVNFRDSIVVSISARHADDPGSIPGRGVDFFSDLGRRVLFPLVCQFA